MKVREIKGSKKLTGHLQNLLIKDKVDRKTGEEYEIKKKDNAENPNSYVKRSGLAEKITKLNNTHWGHS
jgi:hypothetical protein